MDTRIHRRKESDEYLADLPTRDDYIYKRNGPGFKKGDTNQTKLDEEIRKNGKTARSHQRVRPFPAADDATERYDYDDMINWVIRAFTKNEDLLRRYQEKFQYILVDEFQDTSGTQNKLVEPAHQFLGQAQCICCRRRRPVHLSLPGSEQV